MCLKYIWGTLCIFSNYLNGFQTAVCTSIFSSDQKLLISTVLFFFLTHLCLDRTITFVKKIKCRLNRWRWVTESISDIWTPEIHWNRKKASRLKHKNMFNELYKKCNSSEGFIYTNMYIKTSLVWPGTTNIHLLQSSSSSSGSGLDLKTERQGHTCPSTGVTAWSQSCSGPTCPAPNSPPWQVTSFAARFQ